jgi:alkylhydroperoxidase/carboxymuconolactone decarboxylase family protein YurZ
MSEDDDREAIKANFVAQRGYWRPWTEALLRDNPRFLKRYADYAGHPARTGPLPERMVELIYVALDASATHLHENGLRTHVAHALAIGVRPREILDVLHLVAAQGVDAVWSAAGVLADACAAHGLDLPPTSGSLPDPGADPGADPRARMRRLGILATPDAMACIAGLDPGYLPVLLDFLEHGRPDDGLAEPDRALVEVALRACFTGYDADALRQRIDRALTLGRTPSELLQAIQLGAHLAVHGTALGAGTLALAQERGAP